MKIHAFIDAENISQRLFVEGCSRLQEDHELVQIDVFGKSVPSGLLDTTTCAPSSEKIVPIPL